MQVPLQRALSLVELEAIGSIIQGNIGRAAVTRVPFLPQHGLLRLDTDPPLGHCLLLELAVYLRTNVVTRVRLLLFNRSNLSLRVWPDS